MYIYGVSCLAGLGLGLFALMTGSAPAVALLAYGGAILTGSVLALSRFLLGLAPLKDGKPRGLDLAHVRGEGVVC